MKYTLYTLLIVLCFITGCAADGPAFIRAEHLQSPDQALICFYRPIHCAALGSGPRIYIDEVEKGQLKPKGYLVRTADPGTRMIEGNFSGLLMTIYLDVVAGEEYYIRWYTSDEFTGSGVLVTSTWGVIPKEYALAEIQKTKRSE